MNCPPNVNFKREQLVIFVEVMCALPIEELKLITMARAAIFLPILRAVS